MNIRKTLLTLCLLFLAAPTLAQEPNPFINLPLEVLADTWLTRNCGIDEESQLEIAVARRGEALQAIFLSAWREGAPEEKLREARAAAAKRFQRNRALLEDPQSLGLAAGDLARYKARSEEGFVMRAASNYDFGYRSQALRGLYFAGTATGREIVQATAADNQSPFNSIARLVADKTATTNGEER